MVQVMIFLVGRRLTTVGIKPCGSCYRIQHVTVKAYLDNQMHFF